METPDFEVRIGGRVVTAGELKSHRALLTPGLLESLEAIGGRAVFPDAQRAVTFMGAMIRAFGDQEVSIVASWAERERRRRARAQAINEEETRDREQGERDHAAAMHARRREEMPEEARSEDIRRETTRDVQTRGPS